MLILPASVALTDPSELERLYAEIAVFPVQPALIVVDTLARNFGGGNENSADDMGRFIDACDKLRTLTGAAVLIIHHENKLGGYRGSTAFEGALDCLMIAKREGLAVTLSCAKMKDDGEFAPTAPGGARDGPRLHRPARAPGDLGSTPADRRGVRGAAAPGGGRDRALTERASAPCSPSSPAHRAGKSPTASGTGRAG